MAITGETDSDGPSLSDFELGEGVNQNHFIAYQRTVWIVQAMFESLTLKKLEKFMMIKFTWIC